jgi:hypothetical protein
LLLQEEVESTSYLLTSELILWLSMTKRMQWSEAESLPMCSPTQNTPFWSQLSFWEGWANPRSEPWKMLQPHGPPATTLSPEQAAQKATQPKEPWEVINAHSRVVCPAVTDGQSSAFYINTLTT